MNATVLKRKNRSDEPGAEPPDEPLSGGQEPASGDLVKKRSIFRRVLQDRDALLGEIVDGKKVPLTRVVIVSFLLTALGGLAIGSPAGPLQAVSAAIKLPIICVGALAVCFPAFYIFGLLQGSKVSVEQVLRMFAVGLGLRGAIVAGLAPLLLFFASVGSPYGFLLIISLVAFGIAECAFLRTVENGIHKLRYKKEDPIGLGLTRVWMAVYLGVVSQMAWSLRPIIKHPDAPWAPWGGYPEVDGGSNMFIYFFKQLTALVS